LRFFEIWSLKNSETLNFHQFSGKNHDLFRPTKKKKIFFSPPQKKKKKKKKKTPVSLGH
jgi:hypothetical protein